MKGIGTVLCLSLLMWMMCMFFYQFEGISANKCNSCNHRLFCRYTVPADYPTPFEALRNTPGIYVYMSFDFL